MRPEGRRAIHAFTHASDPTPHPSHPRGTNAARLPSRQSSPPHQYIHSVQSSHGIPAGSPPQYIHSVPSSQQPLRLRAGGWATNGRLLRPHLRTAGPQLPVGRALTAPAPPGQPSPLSRASREVVRSRRDRWRQPRRLPTETSHACGVNRFAPETPIRPRGRIGRTHAPA